MLVATIEKPPCIIHAVEARVRVRGWGWRRWWLGGVEKRGKEGRKVGGICSAGAFEGVRVLPVCKDQRRSSTRRLDSVSYRHPEAAFTHWQRSPSSIL